MRTLPIIEKLGSWTMEKPSMFSFFHIAFLVFFYLLTFLVILFFRDSSRRTMKTIVFIGWLSLVVLETTKQLVSVYWYGRYYWSNFPFQFCEVPLYVYPILLFNRNKRFENVLIAFCCTFSLFGGFAILTLPFTGLNTLVFHSARTMIHHGIITVIGFYLFAWNRRQVTIKNFFRGSIVFLVVTAIAILFNFYVDKRVPDPVNMFFLNSEYPTELLIIKHIQPHVPWIIFVLLYIVSFYIIALLTFAVEHFTWRLCAKLSRRNY